MGVRRCVLAAACGTLLLGSMIVPTPASAQGYVSFWVGRGPAFYDPWYYPYRSPWYPRRYAGVQRYGVYGDFAASLRIQVRPRDAEVFVNGYYIGVVDDFDGVFQRLQLEPGDHDIEIYLPGYRSVHQRLYLQPGRTSHVRLDMEPLAPGDAAPVRPSGTTSSPSSRPRDPRDPRRPSAPRDRPGVSDQVDPSGAYGTLSLRVQPGDATVLIDGEPWEGAARDERLVVELATGQHVVEIRREGYRPYVTEVGVRGQETTTLNVALTPQ